MGFPIRGAAPLGFSYSGDFAGYPAKNPEFFRRVPGKKSRFFSPGTRREIPAALFCFPIRGDAPLVFSFLRSRSSLVFLFRRVPGKKSRFFCRVPGKKMPILSPGAAPLVFSYSRSRSSCVFLFEEPLLLFFSIRGAAPLEFCYYGDPDFFAGYPAKKYRVFRREPLLFAVAPLAFPIPGTAPLVLFYLRRSRIFCRVPGKKIDFFAGYPAKKIDFVVVAPLVFSYSRSRSSCLFLFEEIPIFLPGTRQKNRGKQIDFFAGYPAKKIILAPLVFPI